MDPTKHDFTLAVQTASLTTLTFVQRRDALKKAYNMLFDHTKRNQEVTRLNGLNAETSLMEAALRKVVFDILSTYQKFKFSLIQIQKHLKQVNGKSLQKLISTLLENNPGSTYIGRLEPAGSITLLIRADGTGTIEIASPIPADSYVIYWGV